MTSPRALPPYFCWFFIQILTTQLLASGEPKRCSRNNTLASNNNIRVSSDSGTIYSPDFGSQSTYPANISCTWVITAQEGYHLQLTFVYLHLFATDSNACSLDGDFVQVRDGDSASSAELGTFCGNDTSVDVNSTGQYLWIRFKSDGLDERRGFVARYKAVQSKKNYTVAILVSLGVIVAVVALLIGAFCCSSLKTFRKNRKIGDAHICRTKSGITISVSPVDQAGDSPRATRVSVEGDRTNRNLLSPDSAQGFWQKGLLTRARSYSF